MYAQSAKRVSGVAGWITIPFVLLSVADGFWKTELLRGMALDFWLFDLAKWIVLPFTLLLFAYRFAGLSGRDYGLVADLGVRDILMLLPLPLITLFLVHSFTMGFFQLLFQSQTPTFNHRNALAALGQLWIVGAFYSSATAGVWESVFFLGLPWLWFSQGRNPSGTAKIAFSIVSGAIFSLAHWENGAPNALGAFAFQFLAVRWYLRLRTLLPIIGAHFLIDLYYFWPAAKI